MGTGHYLCGIMLLHLIRHTSVGVPQGTCYGWTDVPVSETFNAEAAGLRRRLEGLTFTHVYSSPLSRALLLAEACGYTHPVVDDRLREMHMGDWEMRRFTDLHGPALQAYYNNYIDTPTPDGESFRQLYGRVASFLDELRHTLPADASVALFCHGGPIICAQVYAGVAPLERGYELMPAYASLTTVELAG